MVLAAVWPGGALAGPDGCRMPAPPSDCPSTPSSECSSTMAVPRSESSDSLHDHVEPHSLDSSASSTGLSSPRDSPLSSGSESSRVSTTNTTVLLPSVTKNPALLDPKLFKCRVLVKRLTLLALCNDNDSDTEDKGVLYDREDQSTNQMCGDHNNVHSDCGRRLDGSISATVSSSPSSATASQSPGALTVAVPAMAVASGNKEPDAGTSAPLKSSPVLPTPAMRKERPQMGKRKASPPDLPPPPPSSSSSSSSSSPTDSPCPADQGSQPDAKRPRQQQQQSGRRASTTTSAPLPPPFMATNTTSPSLPQMFPTTSTPVATLSPTVPCTANNNSFTNQLLSYSAASQLQSPAAAAHAVSIPPLTQAISSCASVTSPSTTQPHTGLLNNGLINSHSGNNNNNNQGHYPNLY